MSYVRSSGGEPVDRDTLLRLGRLVGLSIPEEDIEPLGVALRDQLASAELLDALDLTDVPPATRFDPRWHE